MELLKVDIKTGRVLLDNLDKQYSKEAKNQGVKLALASQGHRQRQVQPGLVDRAAGGGAVRAGALVGGATFDEALMDRIKNFSGKKLSRKGSWTSEELYYLALLGKRKNVYKYASTRLGRSTEACLCMYKRLRRWGVI